MDFIIAQLSKKLRMAARGPTKSNQFVLYENIDKELDSVGFMRSRVNTTDSVTPSPHRNKNRLSIMGRSSTDDSSCSGMSENNLPTKGQPNFLISRFKSRFVSRKVGTN